MLAVMMVFGLVLMPGCGAKNDNLFSERDQPGTSGQNQGEDQRPEEEPPSIGLIGFRTQDIDGNEVNQDIFKDYPLTLVRT